jgi:hypothetical protein
MAMLDTNMPICCDRCIKGGRGASEIPVLAWHHWPLVDEFPQSPNHPKCFGLFFSISPRSASGNGMWYNP